LIESRFNVEDETMTTKMTTLGYRERLTCAALAVATAMLTTMLFVHVLFIAPVVA
jgi:hypothetical protein